MFKWIKRALVKVIVEVLQNTEVTVDPAKKTGRIKFKPDVNKWLDSTAR